jgi:dTDP-4-amino-4,6-dideoxygalactose transaminase
MFSRVDELSVGSIGDLGCFSTYVAHFIVGGVGGIVTTSDDRLAELCRSFMAHGRDSIYLSIDDDDNQGSKLQSIIERRYSFDRVGYSYRATELEAAIALSELKRWKKNISTRQRNARLLTQLLSPVARFLDLPITPLNMTHSFMMYPMVVRSGVDQNDFLLYLEEHGIETRYLLPLLSQPIYKRLFPGELDKNPIAKRLEQDGFFIGIHQGLRTADIRYVADVFKKYFEGRS